ncbi:alpha/beta fold hydrolase [Bradyrhizobium sp. STM 3557]|uniref:alpha/beta fold hydrolase n=1 Tax=Bradyrhizobium sp. STM 3557 TaxID=578920 RepID=UPI00388DED7D
MENHPLFQIFSVSDVLRRTVGLLLDKTAGLAPLERPWHAVLDTSEFRLRRYDQDNGTTGPVLIVPAPIKRAYIFDLLPQVSVVARLADAGFSVYLSEWRDGANGDLATTITSIATALDKIAMEHGRPPIVLGHSLGGTLAAITAALNPGQVQKLLLIEAPLRFGEQIGALRPVTIYPGTPLGTDRHVPGSLLDLASVSAAPDEFAFGRWIDAFSSLLDEEALSIHTRVIRWTLDEFAPSAPLLEGVIDLLYRRDLFARNELHLLGRDVRVESLADVHVAAIVDHSSRVVPFQSALEPLRSPTVISYTPETGVGLQHVGPLVGRRAHRDVWPRVVHWMSIGS